MSPSQNPETSQGVILIKKGDINPPTNLETPPGPLGGTFSGLKKIKFKKLSYGSKTLDMTFEGFGERFEGDSADTFAGKISTSVDGGPSGGSHRRRPGSEDPHQHQWNFFSLRKVGAG